MFPVCINADDLSRILYWHSVFTKTNKPEIKDEGPATKIKALLISMMEEDEEDIIDPHDYQLYCFDEDDDKSIVISKDKPTVYKEGTYVAFEYKKITNILYERNISEINDNTIVIKPINDESQWKTATLKLNFLMKELKRLGADKHETYSCILDLHQDIVIPHDKE